MKCADCKYCDEPDAKYAWCSYELTPDVLPRSMKAEKGIVVTQHEHPWDAECPCFVDREEPKR